MSLKMIHPDIPGAVGDVADVAGFNAVWAPRGWKLLGETETWATEVLGQPVIELDALKVDEIKGLHAARGLEYPSGGKKADLIKTLRDTFAEKPEPEPVVEPEPVEPVKPTPPASVPAASTTKN